jgi:hypothetical protein
LIGQKTEYQLQLVFDLQHIFNTNLRIGVFAIDPSKLSQNEINETETLRKEGQFFTNANNKVTATETTEGASTKITPRPGVIVSGVWVSSKYIDSRNEMARYFLSATLPENVRGAVKELDQAVEKNVGLMVDTFNNKAKENFRLIVDDITPSSQNFGNVSSTYWKACTPLGPLARNVSNSIRKYLGVK